MDLCQKAAAAGVSWITVHGRTADERHQPVHYDAIKTIKDSLSIPVIANGDIKSMQDVEATYALTGVDGACQFNAAASELSTCMILHLISLNFCRCDGCSGVAGQSCHVRRVRGDPTAVCVGLGGHRCGTRDPVQLFPPSPDLHAGTHHLSAREETVQ